MVYVAVGASETFGFGAGSRDDAWPFLFARSALPAGTRVLDLGVPAVTASAAALVEVPAAVAAQPAVVTVWLAVNDLIRGVTPERYERDLDAVVGALRRGGVRTVLVGSTPPLDHLPGYRACRPDPPPTPRCLYFTGAPGPDQLDRITAAYTAAARRVAGREGAVLVDLAGPLVAARREGAAAEARLVASDGFHPSPAGHAAVAAAFAAAYRRVAAPGAGP